jgi:hypothetical protein
MSNRLYTPFLDQLQPSISVNYYPITRYPRFALTLFASACRVNRCPHMTKFNEDSATRLMRLLTSAHPMRVLANESMPNPPIQRSMSPGRCKPVGRRFYRCPTFDHEQNAKLPSGGTGYNPNPRMHPFAQPCRFHSRRRGRN